MAISTPTSLSNNFNQAPTNAQWVSAAGVTFTTGRLYLFAYMMDRAAGGPDLSTGYSFDHGGTGRTWTFAVQALTFATTRTLAVYSYIALATETVTLTYSTPVAVNNANSCAGGLLEITSGFHATAPVVQGKSGAATTALSVSAVMDTPPAVTSLLVSFAGTRGNSTAASLTPRTNWTELFENVGSGTTGDSGSLEAQYTFTVETTASCSVGSNARTWGIAVVEIAEAATAHQLCSSGAGK